MSDPIKDLENFESGGLAVNPLAPDEVRRRGDALRRRRNAGLVAAAVVAVAAIVTPIALLSGGGDDASPTPAPDSDWVTTIPEDFPLAAMLPAENADGSPVEVTDEPASGYDRLVLCDRTGLDSTKAEDLATVRYGAEGDVVSQLRTLALYGTDAPARQALDDTAAALQACPDETVDGREHVYADQGIPVGQQSVVYTHRTRTGGGFDPGVELVGLVRVGNGVLVASRYDAEASGTEDQLGELLAHFSLTLTALAGEMCLFAEDPCAGGSGRKVGEDPSDIPAGFPLDLRLQAMTGDGGVRLGPGAEVVGLAHEQVCGAPLWTMDYLHRLAAVGTGPEFADMRELRTYVSTDEAAIQMDAFLTAVHECPTYGNQVLTVHEADTGHHSITWSRTYSEGLGSEVFQATRVGRSVLLTMTSGEGMLDSVPSQLGEITSLSRDIADEMCVFTEDGCGAGGATSLTAADLIAADETQPRYESAWEIAETFEGEGAEPASPCFGSTFAGRNASSVFRRDFELQGPQGVSEDARLTAVVAEFADRQTAQAAFIGFGEDAGLCEGRVVPAIAEEYTAGPGGEVVLDNVEGQARTWFAEYGPFPGSSTAVYRLETGVAWVGKRLVVMTSMYGPFEPGKPPSPTAMEAMLVQAAERLLPGSNEPVTTPPVMP